MSACVLREHLGDERLNVGGRRLDSAIACMRRLERDEKLTSANAGR
jgi:hypothetical protein